MMTSSAQHVFQISFFSKRSHGFLEKWLILGLEQGICMMNLGYITVPKSKEVLKKYQKKWTNKNNNGSKNNKVSMSKGHGEPTERASSGQSWKNLSKKINNIILDYNQRIK